MKKVFYIIIISILSISSTVSQNRRELEIRRKKLNREIRKIEKILSQTNREKTSALDDLKDFNRKIAIRKELIKTIELENTAISNEIKSNSEQITKNNKELKELKTEYSKLVFTTYKSKSKQSKALFLLSSKDFNQAYKRIKYMEQYKTFRRKQARIIGKKTKLVAQLNDSLKIQKKAKEKLLASKKKEKEVIEKEKEEQKRLLANIKKQESTYKKRLTAKIALERKLTKKIDEIIKNAIAKANKGKKGNTGNLILSKEELNLKARFEQNKGKLPAPVDNGYITRKFGIQPHPTFKKVKINSSGIHIRCNKGDIAKAVFNGKVLVVQLLSQGRKSVFVQHGDYITTYTNLEEVFVSAGKTIKTGEAIGKIFTDKVTGKTSLQFILSKNTEKLNPQKWIKI